jgi:DNA repair protein RecO (recombination protein O)
MQHKLSAIVLRTTPYSDSSVIVRMLTDVFGMQSYVVNGVRKKKAGITMAMLQPLTLVQLEAYHREQAGLQRLSELHVQPVLERVMSQPLYSVAAGLLAECLLRAVREEAAPEDLFYWLQGQIVGLDASADPGVEVLAILSRLTDFLGIRPQESSYVSGAWLNLNEGYYEPQRDQRSAYASVNSSRQWQYLLLRDEFDASDLPGKRYLDDLMLYFQLHLPGFSLPKSLPLFEDFLLARP